MTANLFSEKALKEKAEQWERGRGNPNFCKQQYSYGCKEVKLAYVAGAENVIEELKQLLEDKKSVYETQLEELRKTKTSTDWEKWRTRGRLYMLDELLAKLDKLNRERKEVMLEKEEMR